MTETDDNALALLPAEVRGAFMRINDACIDELPAPRKAVETIRAELLRLAGESAELRSKLDATERGYERWKRSAEGVGAELAQVRTERDALRKRIENAATGTVIEAGDDVDGQPRVLIHSTRDELRKGGPIMFKNVSLVVRE